GSPRDCLALGFQLARRAEHSSASQSSFAHRCQRSEPLMDLVTLVTACALSVDPKLMHALIWHQSGGEPWAVAVQNEGTPGIYSSMQEAISEAHSISIPNYTVRVGLAGLPVSPLKANTAMFLPCRNVAIAAQRIARLADRCKTHPRLKADPTF